MFTIIITGPSGSGKSYLTNKLLEIFDDSIVLKTDSYYKDNILIKFLSIFKLDIYDKPISFKKKEINKTLISIYNKEKHVSFFHYNFKIKESSQSKKKINYTGKNQFLIIEGIFSHLLNINYKDTINFICKVEKEKCFKRRVKRDTLERDRNMTEVKNKFNKSWHLFNQNIKNFKKINKVIFLNPADNNSYDKFILYLNKLKNN
tara:strand:+ start:343 stop:954 length:612 start_codon:yes stop_codon:yes gene_type:complete